jgi:hypothetical protein
MARAVSIMALVALAACATEPPPVERKPAPPPPVVRADAAVPVAAPVAKDPAADVETKFVSEQEWREQTKKKLADRWKVTPADLLFSPNQSLLAFVQAPPVRVYKKPPKRPPTRIFSIVVIDAEGKRQNIFRPVAQRGVNEPPKDLHFLGDEQLVYEVVFPPPQPATAAKRPAVKPKRSKETSKETGKGTRPAAKAKEPPATQVSLEPLDRPTRLFIVQPLRRRARALRCEGVRFTFTERKDRMAYVAGKPGTEFVSVNGVQIHPRKRGGRTGIASDLAWSKDGMALAFVEAKPAGGAQLVLLADVDNPTGDTTWDLPPSANLDGLRVFWPNAHTLIVGRSLGKPVFSTSFEMVRPQ